MDEKYRLDTLQAALQLIDYFLESPDHELGVSEVSRGTGLNKTQTYRILQNLAEFDYVQQNPETRKYRLGLKFLFAGRVVSLRLDLLRVAQPVLDQVRGVIDETVHLVLATEQGPVCIAERQSSHRIRFFAEVGMRLPWHAGSASKLLLAYLPPERQSAILHSGDLEAFTQNTITDPDLLREELARILVDGYATSDSEMTVGALAAAAPIHDHTGKVVAAISVVGLAERIHDAELGSITAQLIDAAQHISAMLGSDQGVASARDTVSAITRK